MEEGNCMRKSRMIIAVVVCLLTLTVGLLPQRGMAADVVDTQDAVVTDFGSRNLQMGMQGNDVKMLQSHLAERNYAVGPIDGIFGVRTRRAVYAFQEKHALKVTGMVSGEMFRALKRPAFGFRVLRMGMNGEDVKRLQALLAKEYDYLKTIDGIFGRGTYEAVIKFQERKGLKVDGIVTLQTFVTLQQDLAPSPDKIRNYDDLRKHILDYISLQDGIYGVYVKDLKTGRYFSVNGNAPYIAASTYKVPENLCLYEKVIAGEIDLDEEMVYTQADYETGTGSIQYQPLGTRYTLRELVKLNMTVSDNVAKNMIKRKLGRETIINYMDSLGGRYLPIDKNITSPRDMKIYMEKVLELNVKHPEVIGEFIHNLKHTEFNDRINKLLPPDIEVAHKIGNQVNVLNDVGIVYHPSNPYIITILSEHVRYSQASDTIPKISKMIYDYQDSLK